MRIEKLNSNWKDRVLEWQASGKSVRAWCLENHIPVTTFYGWKARLEKSPNDKPIVKAKARRLKKEFIELKDQPSSDSVLTLEYQEVKIHLKANFDKLILRQCLDCLRSALC